MNFSIVCSNLSYEIADRKILDKINISFGSGNKYALIGRNGVGNTTFLKILTNNITDYSGNISGTSRHTIGYLPQQAIEIEGNPTVWELALSYLKKALTGLKNYEDILYENLFILGFN